MKLQASQPNKRENFIAPNRQSLIENLPELFSPVRKLAHSGNIFYRRKRRKQKNRNTTHKNIFVTFVFFCSKNWFRHRPCCICSSIQQQHICFRISLSSIFHAFEHRRQLLIHLPFDGALGHFPDRRQVLQILRRLK